MAAHDDNLGFERLVFFSDAVFAIAITLLVLDLKPQDTVRGGVILWAALAPRLTGFGLSFFVISRYWLAHHQLFGGVRGYDGRLLGLNLTFLAAVVFLPFTTSVVIESPATIGPVMLYDGSLAALGLLMVTLVLTARRPALLKPGETRAGTLRLAVAAGGAALVFVLSVAIAAVSPRLALWSLVLLFPAGLAADRLGRALDPLAGKAVV